MFEYIVAIALVVSFVVCFVTAWLYRASDKKGSNGWTLIWLIVAVVLLIVTLIFISAPVNPQQQFLIK